MERFRRIGPRARCDQCDRRVAWWSRESLRAGCVGEACSRRGVHRLGRRVLGEYVRSDRRYESVVFVAEVRDEIFVHHPAHRVLQLHRLNEQVVLRIQVRRCHRTLEVEAQPFLRARETSA